MCKLNGGLYIYLSTANRAQEGLHKWFKLLWINDPVLLGFANSEGSNLTKPSCPLWCALEME